MEWQDFYMPVDFYGQAQFQAKRFARKNPDADRELIYLAASEAAERYERSERLRTSFSFRTWCYLQMKTAVYIAGRKESEKMTPELKAAIITDYEAGMKAREIAEKYELDCRCLRNNIGRWKKSGAIRTGEPAEADEKTESPTASQKEKPPSPSEAGEGKKDNYEKIKKTIVSIPQPAENVKSLNYVAAAEALRHFADEYFRSYFGEVESVAVYAKDHATYTLRAGGTVYTITIRGEEKA